MGRLQGWYGGPEACWLQIIMPLYRSILSVLCGGVEEDWERMSTGRTAYLKGVD